MHRNRLGDETSPYLLQHAANPVHWYPWGSEALNAAQGQNKPILLSIGYSACHWCHVMAHESFEDAATAELMNRLFINIKVDREERPDLDRIYQIAQQLLTQSPGGWPLTMFLSPQGQTPFFGGTYFGKVARRGMPAFTDILTRVAEYFRNQQQQIDAQTTQLVAAFERLQAPAPASDLELDTTPLAAARAALEQAFDGEYGGFGGSPKFPQASSITRCLRHWHGMANGIDPDLKSLYMASLTLTRMAEGGFYDQLGGGFARYSVDAFWMIPHFEKMLYDNGQLLFEYAAAASATGDELFAKIAGETADWLLRDMRSHAGGFYSSLDADSEGHEGRFYVWTRAELETNLTREEYSPFAARYAVDGPPNFEDRWHLRVHREIDEIAAQARVSADEIRRLLDSARAKLLDLRNARVWPARDDKILTAWNALTIKGLAHAARILNRADLERAATAAVDFIHHTLWRDGRLLATFKDGRAHLPAYLDDHAYLLDALLELLQSRWRTSDLTFAVALAEVLLTRFEDPAGGFYFTASDHEKLFHRSKSFSDDSTAAGSAVAAAALTRLGFLLAEPRYLDAAERTLKAAWALLLEYPRGHMSMLNALDDFLTTLTIIVVRGPETEALGWARQLQTVYASRRLIFAIPDDALELPPALADKPPFTPGSSRSSDATGTPGTPRVIAYVCRGMTCAAPLGDLPSVIRLLNEADAHAARSRA